MHAFYLARVMLHWSPLRAALLLAGSLLAIGLQAQTGQGAAPPAQQPSAKPTVEKTDTEGSITYIGKRLWFEVRKRLNLTTEQEEAQQRAAEALVRLKVGGFRIEQQMPVRDPKKAKED